jgi:hypothetical protein
LPVKFGLSGDRRPECGEELHAEYTHSDVALNPTTLSEYLGAQDEIVLVLVEHSRCGRSLGVHEAYIARGTGSLGFRPGFPHIDKFPVRLRQPRATPSGTPRPRGVRGPNAAPRVETVFGSVSGEDKMYAVASCTCLPENHVEKVSVEKLGSLLVTFPDWKWGRPVDLPVVTF